MGRARWLVELPTILVLLAALLAPARLAQAQWAPTVYGPPPAPESAVTGQTRTCQELLSARAAAYGPWLAPYPPAPPFYWPGPVVLPPHPWWWLTPPDVSTVCTWQPG